MNSAAHKVRFDDRYGGGRATSRPKAAAMPSAILLDERKLRFQAVVAANDRMAFGALEALQQRGVRVPDDVAVTGFDDLREAQSTGVPLTTVRQSYYTAGRNALQALLKRINGETVQRQVMTPTQVLIRWSCGCLPENVRQAAVAPHDVAKTGKLENKREAAMRALLNSAGITEQDPSPAAIQGCLRPRLGCLPVGLERKRLQRRVPEDHQYRDRTHAKAEPSAFGLAQRHFDDAQVCAGRHHQPHGHAAGGEPLPAGAPADGRTVPTLAGVPETGARTAGKRLAGIQFLDGACHEHRRDRQCHIGTFPHNGDRALVCDVLQRCEFAAVHLRADAGEL